MFFLEDEVPCLRQIYEFDPTYHLFFRHNIVDNVAKVYQTSMCSYIILPYGLYEKVDDVYLIIRLVVRRTLQPGENLRMWSACKPQSMAILFFSSRQEKNAKVQSLNIQNMPMIATLDRRQFNIIYTFDFIGQTEES